MSYVTDTGQGFAAKAVSANGSQILESFQLGCSEALAKNWQVLFVDSMAIVSNLKKFEATLLDQDVERGRASIDSILDELLQGMDRSDNNFTSSDLVDDIRVQLLL